MIGTFLDIIKINTDQKLESSLMVQIKSNKIQRKILNLLQLFSIYSNSKILFDSKFKEDEIICLHLIRFLSLVFVY